MFSKHRALDGLLVALALSCQSSTAAPVHPVAERTIVTVGDLIYTQAVFDAFAKASPKLLNLLQTADITFGNLEESLIDPKTFGGSPQAESGGSWLLGPPAAASDLKHMGFRIVSRANNHATDWGVEGLEATDRLLDRFGIVHAGTGADLSAAARPSFLATGATSTALVSATTSFSPMSPAQDGTDSVGGRPGANAIRTERTVLVNQTAYRTMADIAALLPKRDHNEGEPGGRLTVLGNSFKAAPSSQGVSYEYQANASDLQRVLASVREAAADASTVIVSIHSHQSRGLGEHGFGLDQETPSFLRDIAHGSIDAGATMFVAHGPHILRGIEIYKGRPIFYSMGNFFFMEDQLAPLPRDFYDKMKIAPGAKTPVEVMEISRQRRFNDKKYFESAVAKSIFAGSSLVRIEITPITLGFEGPDDIRGIPRIARGEVAARILGQLAKMSLQFGTKVEVRGDVGVIQVAGEK